MNSMQRVLKALSFQEPDRVPFFLLLTMHGAKELGQTIKSYFSRAENVVEGQLRLIKKYEHDCIYGIFYAAVEIEAWGGEVIFREDGPPNSGEPFIRDPEEISALTPPDIKNNGCLLKVLKTIEKLKTKVGGEVPIVGVVVSPFSLPVMQMGFDKYIELIYERTDLFHRLMEINRAFCVEWANAQFEAGATAIGYFDPVSSPTIIPREVYLKTGFQVAKKTLSLIKGPTAIHFASGRCLPIVEDVIKTGTSIIGVSTDEDLAELKTACRGKLTILGNLNGIEMRRWTDQETERAVKNAIAKAGIGGGFILSDNHGEIPWHVKDETLHIIAQTIKTWGQYPLRWVEKNGR